MVINIYYGFMAGLRGQSTYEPFSELTELLDRGWMDKRGLVYLSVVSIVILAVLGGAGLVSMAREDRPIRGSADGSR